MQASRCVRAGGALGRLLLVVLALGVFAMHTVGHPGDSSGPGTSTMSHASPMDAVTAAGGSMGASGFPEPRHEGSGHATSSPDEPAVAMDMVSLCLAVLLAGWALAALLRAAFRRRTDRLAALLARAPVVQRPHPPPRGPDLTRLSVLRL